MNILYIHCHDMGRCNQVYGADIATPALRQLSNEGATVFRSAFSVAPTCSPSRAGLLTGQHPHQQGLLGLTHRGHMLNKPERHLACWLGQRGYHTALVGVQHEFHPPRGDVLPYAEVIEGKHGVGPDGYDAAVAEAAADWLAARKEVEPFFLSVGFFWPHVPLPTVAQPSKEPLIQGLPDSESLHLDSASLGKAVQHTDACIGKVVTALKASGLDQTTMVLITTDHGVPFPMNKATLYDRGTGVTFILRVPGITGPAFSHDLVSQLDFFPTVCEALELDPPDWLEGTSLIPHLRGDPHPVGHVFSSMNDHVDFEPCRAVRNQEWKLIHNLQSRKRYESNVDATRLKEAVSQDGYFDAMWPDYELYHLTSDPEEKLNLAANPECREKFLELQAILHEWMIRTGDPVYEAVCSGKPMRMTLHMAES